MHSSGQSQTGHISAAFSKIKDTEKRQALIDFYYFWQIADEQLLASSTSKDVVDHERDPTFEGSDYAGLLFLGKLFQAVSGLKYSFEVVEELTNNWVFIRWTGSCQYTGGLFGFPATLQTVYADGRDILHLEDGKIVELYHMATLFKLYAMLESN